MYMMMKRFFAFWSLLLVAVCASAVPAKPGIWKTLLLDGVEVKAQLVGDEHLHYWLSEDGRNLVEKDGRFVLADVDAMRQTAIAVATLPSIVNNAEHATMPLATL